jgi:hypothetical protein
MAAMNHELIRDEGHRNPMTPIDLEPRTRGWLGSGDFRAMIFEDGGAVVAYALYRELADEVHLRHFFVVMESL